MGKNNIINMENKLYVAMKLHEGKVHIDGNGVPIQMKLPEGCQGILMAFKTKKSAREFFGKDVELMEIEKVVKK